MLTHGDRVFKQMKIVAMIYQSHWQNKHKENEEVLLIIGRVYGMNIIIQRIGQSFLGI